MTRIDRAVDTGSRSLGLGQDGEVVVENSPHPPPPMPLIHITLQCAMPTAHPDGAFRTLVAVTDEELLDGDHLREAVRRASIIGFGGPHRVLASRQLDGVAPDLREHPHGLQGQQALRSARERLETLLTLATVVEQDVVELEDDDRSTSAGQQSSVRRAESGPGKSAR